MPIEHVDVEDHKQGLFDKRVRVWIDNPKNPRSVNRNTVVKRHQDKQ